MSTSVSEVPWYMRLPRYLDRRPWIMDTLVWAVPLALIGVLSFGAGQADQTVWGRPSPPALLLALELLTTLPLALRRTRPAVSAGLIATGAALQVLLLTGPASTCVTVPAAVYATAKYGSRRVSLGYLLLALAGALLLGAFFAVQVLYLGPAVPFRWEFVIVVVMVVGFAASVVVACWLLGAMSGRKRREIQAISERNRLLEREREQEARLAADAERMRIAREMHDVISHSMSVMIAQADGGRYVLNSASGSGTRETPTGTAQAAGHVASAGAVHAAEGAFGTIAETGREALAQMRRMLGVLREEGEALQMRPAPGLSDLPRLIADVRATGLPVVLEGDPAVLPPLPEGAGLAMYRIVQEALTNVMKHAGPEASATVSVQARRWPAPELVVCVRDDGLGSAAAGDGQGSGLLGMRERAALYGGVVETYADARGFQVLARFPLPGGMKEEDP
ncbi:sensor histidine kinase [Sediminivirga luteola]|nr:histidine kinase [Sediminivirga luteola]